MEFIFAANDSSDEILFLINIRRYNVKLYLGLLLFSCILLFYSCKDTSIPTPPTNSVKILFTLEANKQNDSGSTNVTFTGRLSGSYDTLRVTDPGAFILGIDSAVAPYMASTTLSKAKNSYVVSQKVWSGTYKVVMLLKCANGLDILSDTLVLNVLPNDADVLRNNVKLYDEYTLAMNKDSIAAMFTATGQMISGTTVIAQTPEGIKNYLASFDGVVKVLQQNIVITYISVNGSTAVITGIYTQKYKLLSNNQTGTSSGNTRFEWTKIGNKWYISKLITN
jgi:hypothetical protein